MNSISGNYPETLILEPGDDVTATYQRLEQGHNRDGKARAIAIIEVDGGERSLWLHETALRGQFRELKPEPGEQVRIRKGSEKKKGGNGFNYWPFKITAPDRPVEPVSWDSPLLGDGDGDEPEIGADAPIDTSDLEPVAASPRATQDDDIPFFHEPDVDWTELKSHANR